MELPGPVRDQVSRHLDRLDALAPGRLGRLYLTGSVALGDYHDGVSDIDFLAVLSRAVDPAALAGLHRELPDRPGYDGVYLTSAQWTARPDDEPAVPHVVGGQFHVDQPCAELNPVLWLTLTRYPVVVREPAGGAARPLRPVDPERLRRWNLDNLRGYWLRHAAELRRILADRPPDGPVRNAGVEWTVLGPGRLHHTLATGDVISKSAAGRYLAGQFPTWADLARRAVASRQGAPEVFVPADGLAAVELTEAVVADAVRRWG